MKMKNAKRFVEPWYRSSTQDAFLKVPVAAKWSFAENSRVLKFGSKVSTGGKLNAFLLLERMNDKTRF